MRIFQAIQKADTILQFYDKTGIKLNYLIAYNYLGNQTQKLTQDYRSMIDSLYLESGGYAVRQGKAKVTLSQYLDYLQSNGRLFAQVNPERITLGTLRFEPGFYKMRQSIFTTGPELPEYLERMQPMFEPQIFPGSRRPKVGKYSFVEEERVNIFRFVIEEIRKYSDCPVALCKESAEVWDKVGLDSSAIRCACQL